MSVRNGTVAHDDERPLDVVLAEHGDDAEPSQTSKVKAGMERRADTMDEAIRKIAERENARRPGHDPTVRVRQASPEELARPQAPTPPARVAVGGEPTTPPHLLGAAGDVVDNDGAPPTIAERIADREDRGLTTPGLPPLPARQPAVDAREDVQVARWRRDQIFEWLYVEGPKTLAEIKHHFNLSQNTARADVEHLRTEARLERTGRERSGPSGGRPSAEFRAVEIDSSHARTGDAEAEQPADTTDGPPGPLEAPRGEAADTDRTIEDGQSMMQGEPAAVGREAAAPEVVIEAARADVAPPEMEGERRPDSGAGELDPARVAEITVHEQLVIRYYSVLISWIERSSIVRDQGPPEHVFDRIERGLGIQDGAS